MIDFKNKRLDDFVYITLCVSCIIFYTLFLSVKKGYIVGVVLALFVALFKVKDVSKIMGDATVKVFFYFFCFFAICMSNSFESVFHFTSSGDYFTKYLVGAFILLGAASVGLSPKVIAYSFALGCISSALLAIYQFPQLGRSEGFTNAIRFGNIAMFMAGCCWIFLLVKKFSKGEKIFLFFAGLSGVVASLLSLSRGGWLIIFTLPLFILFFSKNRSEKIKMSVIGVTIFIVTAFALGSTSVVQERFWQAEQEVSGYFDNRDKYAATSVGARLEQWRLSWNLGWDKPLTGWGVESVEEGRKEYIARGEAHPFMVNIRHTHNEFLEMWATRGIFGVAILVLFYAVPIFIFWPRRKKIQLYSEENQSLYVAINVIGVFLSVSYFIFGLTDVFFNLAIGHNLWILTIVFIVSSIQWLNKNDSSYRK